MPIEEEVNRFLDSEDGEKVAYGDEVHLFLHCHLRGYDKDGTGQSKHADYYDKYGAPFRIEDTWTEGHFIVEKTLGEHFNQCLNGEVMFPVVAGYGGGCHLYQPIHDINHNGTPWNWTGWVPLQRKWISQAYNKMFFHRNRYFMTLRGNEVQNNLWDYHPHEEEQETVSSEHDWIYDQISPTDKYRGGYFYKNNSKGRYLHIMSLKTHHTDSSQVRRYNFIVHPLAYRSSINVLPDAAVDGIQWSIMRTSFEEHFNGDGAKNWGERVHGMEIFNDFTYFYSYQANEEYRVHNGELYEESDGKRKIIWFDTYPMEFCEFLLDNSLARGNYLQILSANDAFYNRDILPPEDDTNGSLSEKTERREKYQSLKSDPKGKLVKNIRANTVLEGLLKTKREVSRKRNTLSAAGEKAEAFLSKNPYRNKTIFGYTTLIDTLGALKVAVFPNDKCFAEKLEDGEELMIDYLIKGRFFSHTGVYDVFNYEKSSQKIPFLIENQGDQSELCYTIDQSTMDLVFTFARVKSNRTDILWRYSLEKTVDKSNKRETVNGYFKLNDGGMTKLDLSSSYKKEEVKWIRFTAFNTQNPTKRLWFSPIKGPAFGDPIDQISLPPVSNRIARTNMECSDDGSITYTEQPETFMPTSLPNDKELKFELPKVETVEEEDHLYSYFMQGFPMKANDYPEDERILQNIHGYFPRSGVYSSMLDMKASWDSSSIKSVSFYGINSDTCQPFQINME